VLPSMFFQPCGFGICGLGGSVVVHPSSNRLRKMVSLLRLRVTTNSANSHGT
jgi:hypothetical protein